MKISTLLMMIAYVAAAFILVPFLTYMVAVTTPQHLGVNVAAGLATLTAALLVAIMMFIGDKIPYKIQNRPL